RRTHRHSGSLQLGGQLAAAPAFAIQREQFFAQRFQQVFGGPPFFRRLAFRQLRQLFLQCRVIQLRGDLRVINACAHTNFTSLSLSARLWFSVEQPLRLAASAPAHWGAASRCPAQGGVSVIPHSFFFFTTPGSFKWCRGGTT